MNTDRDLLPAIGKTGTASPPAVPVAEIPEAIRATALGLVANYGADPDGLLVGAIGAALLKARNEAIAEEREGAAKECEQQAREFLSPQYVTNQPLGSFGERFACDECARAIRARP